MTTKESGRRLAAWKDYSKSKPFSERDSEIATINLHEDSSDGAD